MRPKAIVLNELMGACSMLDRVGGLLLDELHKRIELLKAEMLERWDFDERTLSLVSGEQMLVATVCKGSAHGAPADDRTCELSFTSAEGVIAAVACLPYGEMRRLGLWLSETAEDYDSKET